MRIAVVGCGFVADYYASTLPNHPELQLIGVMDRDRTRADKFASYWRVPTVYPTLEALLDDPRVELVLNLTNPRSHFEVTSACLMRDRHVYSEKPLATDFSQAETLVTLAVERGLYLSSAPCNVLGESAQTAWKALRQGTIGTVRLAYAELDDGLIHRMRYKQWVNPSGAPWPYLDEFEVGCTLEHAAYYVSWLASFFGPATFVTSYAGCLIPDKQTDVPLANPAPDFATASIQFASGAVARLTCSIIAPHDHSLRVFGDEGTLSVAECWDYACPVYLKRRTSLALRAERFKFADMIPGIGPRRLPFVRPPRIRHRYKATHVMDFARGVSELAAAIEEKRPSRLSARFSLHVNEIVLAMQHPDRMGTYRRLTSSFDQPEPMAWAR